MDTLIEDGNFLHDDNGKYSVFEEAVDEWRDKNREKVTASQVFAGIKALTKKFLQHKCPTYDTEGWRQAQREAFGSLIEPTISELHDEDKIQIKDVREAYYKLYLEWLKDGPATIHLGIMDETFSSSDVDMEEYMKSLTGDSLTKLIAALTSPIVKNEDTADAVFYEQHRRSIDRFIGNAVDVTNKDITKQWLEYIFHLYLDYLHLDKECLEHVCGEADDRLHEIDDHWESFSDEQCVRSLIKKITAAVKNIKYLGDLHSRETVSKPISKLCKKLRQPGDAEKYCNDIFDLLEAVSKCEGEFEEVRAVFREVLSFFDDQPRNMLKKKIEFFKVAAPRYTQLFERLDMKFVEETKYCTVIMDRLEESFANNKTLVEEWISMAVPLVTRPCYNSFRAASTVLGCDEVIRWKEHVEVANQLMERLAQIKVPKKDSEDKDGFFNEYHSCIRNFIRGLENGRILKNYGEQLMYLAVELLETKRYDEELFNLVESIGEHIVINMKEKKDSAMKVMKRIHEYLKDEDAPWIEKWSLQRAVEDTISHIIEPVNDGRIFTDDDLKVFVSMCRTCLSKEAVNPTDGSQSAHFIICNTILGKLLQWMTGTKRLGYAVQLIPMLLSKYEDDEENVNIMCGRYLNDFATGEAATTAPYMEQLIKIYLDKEDLMILSPIMATYAVNPAPMKSYFQDFMLQLIDSGEPQIKSTMAQLFWSASKKQPELFTDQNIKDILNMAKDDPMNQSMMVLIIQELSKRKPEKMGKHINTLIDRNGWDPNIYSWLNDILSTLALYNKNHAGRILDFLIDSVKDNQDKGVLLTALNSVRLIGFKYPDVISPRRAAIERLVITDSDGQAQKQTILDMIDGKTPENLRKQLESQQNAIGDLVDKVEDVEDAVIAVQDKLDEHDQKIDEVKGEVNQQGQRLNQVEETVEETVAKVEEIDGKTLSHAPYWSRDISKLLNPATDHDWRLLSSRLGYTNADVRGWAQQADPCMAMLNEWYATRKTSDATFAILNNLQEMDRMDAALIVENAMKKAEAVVEDEEFEYAEPPPVFISYQWGHQEEVKLLQRHLAMAGYDCWLDIGQMGGGDKLFEKIDTGMRAAKVVISCVTAKYAKSPNCNREVNLAVGVNKPIIPLLLESCPWPPPGSMGPLFSESLYIRFFQTGTEQTQDDRYWPLNSFQELLMQLSVNGLVPDEGKIEPIYRDWWLPMESEIKIDKSKTQNGGEKEDISLSEDTAKTATSPDVFISYQWGKQKNIIKLYQRLTSLGLSCWLDIKQMGGGDSLYDKIDKGIRGSKVVLSCVTKNYALSANCRREVSLADALKKPLLPLLLDEMTWPPTGPMSMVMTQLLYISFQQEKAQTEWDGPQFDELIKKINQHLPTSSSLEIKHQEKKQASSSREEKRENSPKPPPQPQKAKTDNKEPKEHKSTSTTTKPPVASKGNQVSKKPEVASEPRKSSLSLSKPPEETSSSKSRQPRPSPAPSKEHQKPTPSADPSRPSSSNKPAEKTSDKSASSFPSSKQPQQTPSIASPEPTPSKEPANPAPEPPKEVPSSGESSGSPPESSVNPESKASKSKSCIVL